MVVTSIQLRVHFEGDGIDSPLLDSWKVTWKKKIPQPKYLGGIPSSIPVTEDIPKAAILDLSQYFGETRSSDFTYGIESITDDVNINVEINDSYLDVTYLEDNWTGKTDIVMNCTNDYGESVSSDEFSIVVQRVDDAPAWSSEPPPISIDEDDSYTSASSYMDYLIDAENDMLTLGATCDVTNVTIQMSPEGYLTVIPEEDYFGPGEITITASEIYAPALKAVTTRPLTINAVNDDPEVKSISPGDGAVYNDTNITLSWEAEDIDTPDENITFGVYFGETKAPSLYMSDVSESHIDLDGLSDKTTYYWYVEADDGDGGKAASPTWSFSIDTESEVIPGDTDTNTDGLNVTIEVDATKIVVEQGNETSFELEIKNDGEKPVTLTVVTSGDTAPCLSLNNFITLSALETKKETVKVTRTSLLEPGNYTISLVFVSPDGMKYVSIPLWIKEGDNADDGTGGDNGNGKPGGDTGETKEVEGDSINFWLYLVIGLLFLFIIFIAVASSVTNSRLRKRMNDYEKRDVEEEVLEGDAYIPERTPFQPRVDDRTQMPVSPGPYQPQQQLPGQPFEPRMAAFQPQQSAAPQLPTSQPTPVQETAEAPSVSAQTLTDADISAILGAAAATPVPAQAASDPVPQVHESLQTPIPPLVQLPQKGGAAQQQEQKMLPENAAGAPPST